MKILATWDDGAVQDLRIAELMNKYNIPTIFYWPYNLEKSKNLSRVKKCLTMVQCLELARNFEVGSHTLSHQFLTTLSTQQASNEIFDSRKAWQDATGQPINSFCYPRNKQNTIIKLLVKNAGYTNARTTIVGHLTPGNDAFAQPTTVHMGIDRVEYKNICWEMFAREMLKKATDDSLFHLFGHSWEIDLFNDWTNLEALLKELK